MPLSALIDFIAAQERSRGNRLAHPDMSYVEVTIPALTTVRWDFTPGNNYYMSYYFRMLIDQSVVPDAFQATAYIYGVAPLTSQVQGSITQVYMDYFLRVFHDMPLRTEVTNLTNLNQRWVGAGQFLQVSAEDDYIELEKRIAAFHGQSQSLALVSIDQTLKEMGQVQRQALQIGLSP